MVLNHARRILRKGVIRILVTPFLFIYLKISFTSDPNGITIDKWLS